ncbi:MAG: lipoyl(octanoyl) transferase LipB [Deltaproteobacteria bacterium]|nr:lipoyl(octanoyl) transferase LipB [Deltaproteobacteria bacterium]MBW2086218.1 lipoyl(octanoyl) transferase LipB [Deltaproteobacteria bacterium]
MARLLNLDHLPYTEALALMRELIQAKQRELLPEVLILVEHDPVLTLGYRARFDDILIPEKTLHARNIDVHRVERGGLVTYHGPGQLLAYPIFNLRNLKLGVARFINLLEEVIISTLRDFGLEAGRKENLPGVWVRKEKIASIGVAVRRWITFHGLALNYDPELSHFELINPCGMTGVKMTSIARLLGSPVSPTRLRNQMIHHFERLFNLDFSPWSLPLAQEAGRRYEP